MGEQGGRSKWMIHTNSDMDVRSIYNYVNKCKIDVDVYLQKFDDVKNIKYHRTSIECTINGVDYYFHFKRVTAL